MHKAYTMATLHFPPSVASYPVLQIYLHVRLLCLEFEEMHVCRMCMKKGVRLSVQLGFTNWIHTISSN